MESTALDYYNARSPCDTVRVGELIEYRGYGIATQMGSELKYRLGIAVLTLRHNGDLMKLYNKWFSNGCKSDQLVHQRPLNLQNVIHFFCFIGTGFILIILLFLIEYFWEKKKNLV